MPSSSLSLSSSSSAYTSSPGFSNVNDEPDHLLVLVHGILASPSDWIYVEAKLKKRLGRNYMIYASSCNSYTKTFGGIDGAGKRLADEVLQIVKITKSLRKISFLAHSLGGLFTRYAIAVLYTPYAKSSDQHIDNLVSPTKENNTQVPLKQGLIAGLQPINFITLATPHLGVRGRKQDLKSRGLPCYVIDSNGVSKIEENYAMPKSIFVASQFPLVLGVNILEKIAAPVAAFLVGRTGSQLFLTDGKPNKPPMLLRMACDCEEGKFISSLGAFTCRMVYANVSYDHLVGWRTSSIRREAELVKPPLQSLDGYKHVVDVEYCPPVLSEGPNFAPKLAKAKEAAQNTPSIRNTLQYHEIIEEEMIRGLQRLGWKKVDVNFHSTFWPFFAHNNIHVKSEWFHNAGAGVVAHVADSIRRQETQQESSSFITANL